MEYKIYRVEKGFIAVSDEEIKEKDYAYNTQIKRAGIVIKIFDELITIRGKEFDDTSSPNNFRKIIGVSGLHFKGVPQFEILSIKEDDSEAIKFSEKYAQELIDCRAIGDFQRSWIESIAQYCYKAAQLGGNYSKEDLENTFAEGVEAGIHINELPTPRNRFDKHITILEQLKEPIAVEFEKEIMDAEEAYNLYRHDTVRMFHFHHYDTGRVTIKKRYQYLYSNFKITKSEQYPDGLLGIKNLIYE